MYVGNCKKLIGFSFYLFIFVLVCRSRRRLCRRRRLLSLPSSSSSVCRWIEPGWCCSGRTKSRSDRSSRQGHQRYQSCLQPEWFDGQSFLHSGDDSTASVHHQSHDGGRDLPLGHGYAAQESKIQENSINFPSSDLPPPSPSVQRPKRIGLRVLFTYTSHSELSATRWAGRGRSSCHGLYFILIFISYFSLSLSLSL